MSAWLVWLILAGVLAVAETASLSFVLLMAAGGAAVGAVVAAVGVPVVGQVGAAVVASGALLWLARPVAMRHLHSGAVAQDGTQALVGSDAVVLQRVGREPGRVKLRGGEWTARALDETQDLPPGAVVSVVAIDGATAVVWQDPLAPREWLRTEGSS